MSYNRFQYWVKGPRLKKLHKLAPIEDKIRNGDFDWPQDVEKDYLNQKKQLDKRVEAYKESRVGSSQSDIELDIVQVFKKTRVTLMKVEEEMYNEEVERLQAFKEELQHIFRGRHNREELWEQVLESAHKEDCKDAMDFYLLYKKHWENLRNQTTLKKE
jgi:multidrug efflux pump subunit AcrB